MPTPAAAEKRAAIDIRTNKQYNVFILTDIMRSEIQERYKDSPEPTLDEINAEIARVRKARRERKTRID